MAWEPHYGAATVDLIAAVHAQDPPLDLTVASDAADWATRLDAQTMPNGTLRCRGGGAIESLAGFADGAWWVQDLASSLPARLLGNVEGRDVIDLCAAPGGKTMQLATAGARVTAIEIGRARAARLNENLARLKLAANVVIADARTWRPEKQADAILLDAPCSATGTIRRHPEIQHLKSRDDALRLTPLQDALLDAAAFMTAPGGTLVYAVCSLEPAEGAERVAAFLSRHTSFLRRSIEPNEIDDLSVCIDAQGDLRTLPCHLADQGGMDGFYAARLVKRR
jgi:16S rRNA (cytosine967-C5)-methyltransferase